MSWTKPMRSPITDFELAVWAETAYFYFAHTMPENPHEYCAKRDMNPETFVAVVEHIRQYGYKRKYRGSAYIQYDIGEWFYWTMGFPIEQTILINRKHISRKDDA